MNGGRIQAPPIAAERIDFPLDNGIRPPESLDEAIFGGAAMKTTVAETVERKIVPQVCTLVTGPEEAERAWGQPERLARAVVLFGVAMAAASMYCVCSLLSRPPEA